MTIYLDHNATTPPLSQAIEAMLPWLATSANASSAHQYGQAAAAAVETARHQVADLIGFDAQDVIFMSSATEANHTYLHGVLTHCARGRLVTSAVEHPSLLGAAEWMSSDHTHERLRVTSTGVTELPSTLPSDTRLLSIMAANHETGVVQPLSAAADLAARHDVPFHVDATQVIGKMALDFTGVTAVTLSAHKFGGCQGVGVLAVRSGTGFPSLLHGGGQERGRRAGTSFVAGIVAAGVAAHHAALDLAERRARWLPLKQRLESALIDLGGAIIGVTEQRLPNTTLVTFAPLNGSTLVTALDIQGVAVSAGAACASGSVKESAVLKAMNSDAASSAIRFSLGPATTMADIETAITVMTLVLNRARRRG